MFHTFHKSNSMIPLNPNLLNIMSLCNFVDRISDNYVTVEGKKSMILEKVAKGFLKVLSPLPEMYIQKKKKKKISLGST